MIKTKFVAAMLASAAFLPGVAMAQDASGEKAEANDGLGVIMVTANRTVSEAQDTPIALNVYSGDDLAEQGVSTVRDLSQIDPSVNVTNSTGAAYVAVRGIASTDTTEIGDPSVPIARDGFFTNRSFSINSSFYDVARIEVLKGPQGTLQGRNSTGGLVSVITNRPEFRTGGYGSLELGNYGTVNGEAGLNLAITPHFAVRASGTILTHDGYRTSPGPAISGDDEDFRSGRIQALYDDGSFSAWLSYQHDSRDVSGDAQFKGPLGGPVPDFGDGDVFASDAPTYTTLEGDRARWELSYTTDGGMNFIYSGGYDEQTWKNALDATSSYPANRQFLQSEAPRTWNHEVRISNDRSGPLFFQAGYFYFRENNTIDSGIFNLDMTGPFAPGGFLSGLPNADQSNTYGLKFDYDVRTSSQALFAQVEYDLTDTLQLSLGGRYTWDRKDRNGTAVIFLPALAFPLCGNDFPADPNACPPFPLVTPGDGSISAGEPTWHLGLNYRPNADTLFYVKYDRGYKSGGFNSNGSAPSVDYGPERLDAFEIGTKNTLAGNTLQLNASAFYFSYSGYQGSQFTTAVSSGSGVFNVGSASIFGVEGSAVALLDENTRFNLNAAFLNTEFGDNIFIVNGNSQSIDISGNRLPAAPGFTASAGLEHDFLLSNGAITARVDAKYSSDFYYSVFNTPDTRSDDYVLANASIKYAPDSGNWNIQLYVRNIFDELVFANATQNFNGGANNYQFQAPRTYGVRVGFDF